MGQMDRGGVLGGGHSVRVWALALGLLFCASAACAEMDVRVKAEPSLKEKSYQTYGWLEHTADSTQDIRLQDPALHQWVQEAVDSELSARGYLRQETGEPDFWVGYTAAISGEVDSEEIYFEKSPSMHDVAFGSDWAKGGAGGAAFSRYYEEGELVIDVYDAKAKKGVWKASVQAELQQRVDEEKRRERLNAAVKKMFKKFPPRKP